ncbi:CinA family protein [Thiorhodospira sibirica]|uniref:CinA family protein n=1 Tax=Thiorhodospira sibirica TaxID=154347 RepID=UPI00022C1715|nr:CinA family protein [Thiorhodospira sibirica]
MSPLPELHAQALQLGECLATRGLHLATAESCTGGLVSATLTAIPGASMWFECGFVTYSNAAKMQLLGVAESLLQRHGAVSEPVAQAMAQGALAQSAADLALAITGIAGPSGGTPDKPVGTVCFAWALRTAKTHTCTQQFHGSRERIRAQAAHFALRALIRCISDANGGTASC